MSLEILYRDDELVAVNKPAGHLVHPADEPQPDDLVTMKILRDQIEQHVFPVHRLDRPTCGVLLFALDREVARSVQTALERHEWEKVYLAVVEGAPENSWVSREPIQKKEGAPWREAETHFRTLSSRSELSLVEARPKTGRFHQIRRHLQAKGFPIVGDYRYGDPARWEVLGDQLGIGTRMLLQAKRLTLDHPRTAVPLAIEAPTDPLIEQLGFEL